MFNTAFGITIDLSFWQWFINLPLLEAARVLFALGGWVIVAYVFFKALAEMWVDYRQSAKHTSRWGWVVLAVDIPPLFIQSPKAVEQIFAHLSGASDSADVLQKFWHGKKQKWFSFEIVSIEGYIQFLVRTEAEYRDLVEAAIYAQYTEAEITEVEDYVDNIPNAYPDSEYDLLGVEFKLAEKDAYPIRTYPGFEYKISKDEVFSDPMAAVLENFSRIGHGENLWMQLIIEPVGNKWKEEGIELAKKLLGQEKKKAPSLMSRFAEIPGVIAKELMNALRGSFEEEEKKEEKPEKPELTPGERETVEAIEEKISKLGFKTKLRILYAARKSDFKPNHAVPGFIGSLGQFHIQSRNALVPYMSTHAHYDAKGTKSNKLKNSFVKVFKKRKAKWKKCGPFILNIEELATIWHFPLPFVKTPLLQKAGHKRSEPPAGLPTEVTEHPLKRRVVETAPPPPIEPAPPVELPYG